MNDSSSIFPLLLLLHLPHKLWVLFFVFRGSAIEKARILFMLLNDSYFSPILFYGGVSLPFNNC